MAKFEVGQRVKVTGNMYWLGVGIVERARTRDLTRVRLDSGTFAYLTDSEMTLVVETFRPGDIVRAEKGDEIIQGKVYGSEISTTLGDTSMDDLESDGYTLTLVKRPEPEIILPTKFNALVLVDGRTWIRASNDMWFWAFGDWSGIESEKLAAKAKRFDDYRVIFEGENE